MRPELIDDLVKVAVDHREMNLNAHELRCKFEWVLDAHGVKTPQKAPVKAGHTNAYCDGSGPCSLECEVRHMPTGRLPSDGGVNLCRNCYDKEIAYRRERNRDLGKDYHYKLTPWEELRIVVGSVAG